MDVQQVTVKRAADARREQGRREREKKLVAKTNAPFTTTDTVPKRGETRKMCSLSGIHKSTMPPQRIKPSAQHHPRSRGEYYSRCTRPKQCSRDINSCGSIFPSATLRTKTPWRLSQDAVDDRYGHALVVYLFHEWVGKCACTLDNIPIVIL